MNVTFFRQLLLACLLAMHLPVGAMQPVRGLYEATVPVEARTSAAEQAALREALRQVLTKVSGVGFTADDPRLQAVLRRARDFALEFGPAAVEQMAADGISIERVDGLWARFDNLQVDSAIAAAGLPVWSSLRPSTLVWMVMETAPGSYFYATPAADPAAALALRRVAEQRGLPVRSPSYAESEQVLFPAQSAWRLEEESIRLASRRYEPDAILVLRYRWTPAGWVEGSLSEVDVVGSPPGDVYGTSQSETRFSQFETLSPSAAPEQSVEIFPVDLAAPSVAELVEGLVRQFVDRYAAQNRFQLDLGTDRPIELRIAGVESFDRFMQLRRLLEGLEMVRGVKPVAVESNRAVFSAHLVADREVLLRTLERSAGLTRVPGSALATGGMEVIELQPVVEATAPVAVPGILPRP